MKTVRFVTNADTEKLSLWNHLRHKIVVCRSYEGDMTGIFCWEKFDQGTLSPKIYPTPGGNCLGASRPVLCEKMFLCCFSLKAGRKDLTNRHKSLPPAPTTPPPPQPPPSVPPNDVKRILVLSFLRCSTECPYLVYPNSAFFQEGGAMGVGGGGQNFRPVCQVFSPCFACSEGKNNTGTSFHMTQVSLRSLAGFWHTWKFHSKWH